MTRLPATVGLGADAARAARAADILKALAHPLRLRIIALLCDEDLHVNALAERLDASPAIVSQQLRILRLERLVEAEREDGLSHYRIIEPRLRTVVRCIDGCQRT